MASNNAGTNNIIVNPKRMHMILGIILHWLEQCKWKSNRYPVCKWRK